MNGLSITLTIIAGLALGLILKSIAVDNKIGCSYMVTRKYDSGISYQARTRIDWASDIIAFRSDDPAEVVEVLEYLGKCYE